jgi:hypothetical protein
MYGAKVAAFFDGLLEPKFAGKPFMRHYLDYYWHIYWDLHLGVKGDAIPPQVRTIGESFNTVLAFRDPTQPVVYDNYMTVRALLSFLSNTGKTPGSRGYQAGCPRQRTSSARPSFPRPLR